MSSQNTDSPEPRRVYRDPVLDGDENTTNGAMWGWIAGIAVLILVVFVLVGGMTGNDRARSQSAAPPLDVGTCTMIEVGDPNGSRVSLDCSSDKKITFLHKK